MGRCTSNSKFVAPARRQVEISNFVDYLGLNEAKRLSTKVERIEDDGP
jgi:hypothetical protein